MSLRRMAGEDVDGELEGDVIMGVSVGNGGRLRLRLCKGFLAAVHALHGDEKNLEEFMACGEVRRRGSEHLNN